MSPTWEKKPEGWKRKTADMAAYQRAWRKKNRKLVKGYEAKRKKRTPEQQRAKYVRKMRRLHGDSWVPRARKTVEEKAETRRLKGARKRAANPEKILARKKLHKSVKAGRIVPLPCQVCGEKAEGHHPDYSKPRDVVWLCRKHHLEVHAMVAT